MEPHQLVTLLDLFKDLTSTLPRLAEEARELRKEHTALRQQMERIQEAVSAPRAAPPPGARPAPWRRCGRATARSSMPASSARPPASMPRSSPPRPRSAGVAMSLGTTTPSTADAASVPAPGSRPACSQRRTDDLPGPGPRARPLAAACFRQVRRRLAYVRQQEQQLSTLRGFRREMVARTCERIRRETRLQLQARDSHPVADGTWCTDQATTIDVDTPAPRHPQPERCL